MASEITAGEQLGYDQVAAIEDWLRNAIRYEPGSSNIPISAAEVNLKQSGVSTSQVYKLKSDMMCHQINT